LALKRRFDLEGADTYDTRPMSADGSKLRDVEVLADEGAVVPVEFPVSELSRLLPDLADGSGVARGELRFGRHLETAMADVALEATLALICQRCMRPMAQPVASASRVYFPLDETAAARLPMEEETMLAPEGRVRLQDVVAEELLLALPMAPRHENESDCGEAVVEAEPEAKGARRPFADLAKMMGREARPGEVSAGRPDEAPRTRR
jgi:uncharacterized protein